MGAGFESVEIPNFISLRSKNPAKKKGCIKEIIVNLEHIKPLLFEEKHNDIDILCEKLRNLQQDMSQDIFNTQLSIHKNRAESLKRHFMKAFAYSKIKNHIKR